jgi:hypothetical protein
MQSSKEAKTLGGIRAGARGTREQMQAPRGGVHERGLWSGTDRYAARYKGEGGRVRVRVSGCVVGVSRCVCGRGVPRRPFLASFDARNGHLSTYANCYGEDKYIGLEPELD